MRSSRYTIEQVIEAFKLSDTLTQTAIRLGLAPRGGNFKTLKSLAAVHGIPTDHFNPSKKGVLRPGKLKRPIEEYLSNRHRIASGKLHKMLLKLNLKTSKCEKCGITEWCDMPAPLELHHIDANRDNNNISNLIILCANCHAATHTKLRKDYQVKHQIENLEHAIRTRAQRKKKAMHKFCQMCGCAIYYRSTLCKKCVGVSRRNSNTKIVWPSIEELNERLSDGNYSKLSRELGVSDKAIRKHMLKCADYSSAINKRSAGVEPALLVP